MTSISVVTQVFEECCEADVDAAPYPRGIKYLYAVVVHPINE
jgi:hypothetical protein